MENIARNGLDLSLETEEDLRELLANEIYMDIDSEFAIEIQEELDLREAQIEQDG